jgi:hypothetical protein
VSHRLSLAVLCSQRPRTRKVWSWRIRPLKINDDDVVFTFDNAVSTFERMHGTPQEFSFCPGSISMERGTVVAVSANSASIDRSRRRWRRLPAAGLRRSHFLIQSSQGVHDVVKLNYGLLRNAGAASTAQESDAQAARIARFSFSERSGSFTTSDG